MIHFIVLLSVIFLFLGCGGSQQDDLTKARDRHVDFTNPGTARQVTTPGLASRSPSPEKAFSKAFREGKRLEDKWIRESSKPDSLSSMYDLGRALEKFVEAAKANPIALPDVYRVFDLLIEKNWNWYPSTHVQSVIRLHEHFPGNTEVRKRLEMLYKILLGQIRKSNFRPETRHTQKHLDSLYVAGKELDECGSLWENIADLRRMSQVLGLKDEYRSWTLHMGDYHFVHHSCEACGGSYNPMKAYEFYSEARSQPDMIASAEKAAQEYLDVFFVGSAVCDGSPIAGERFEDLLLEEARLWFAKAEKTETEIQEAIRSQVLKRAHQAEDRNDYYDAHKLYRIGGDKNNAQRMRALM